MLLEAPSLVVVDDDPVTCELLCEVFAAEGFKSRFVQSSAAALASLETDYPEVVVSDIRMKGTADGLTLLDRLRQQYTKLPAVLMTAFGSVDRAVRAVKP